jgi:hypothetical protein
MPENPQGNWYWWKWRDKADAVGFRPFRAGALAPPVEPRPATGAPISTHAVRNKQLARLDIPSLNQL